VREFSTQVGALLARARQAQADAKTANNAALVKQLDGILEKILTAPCATGSRGSRRTHRISAGMTSGVDQKVGKDAIDRVRGAEKGIRRAGRGTG
jgi:hypothetical protein